MAPAPSAPGTSAAARAPRPPLAPSTYRPWLGPLLVGLCFGLGYGLTDRLLRLNPSGWVPLGQNFDHRPAPGTTLESLRQRSGETSVSVRGDLEALEEQAALERQAALDREREKAQQALTEPASGEPTDPALAPVSPADATAPAAPSLPPSPAAGSAPRPASPVAPAPVPPP
jgi:hypothetical protein